MEEKHFRDDPTFMLIRFGKKDRLESLQKGCLYMKNLQYFIDLEKNDPASSGGGSTACCRFRWMSPRRRMLNG